MKTIKNENSIRRCAVLFVLFGHLSLFLVAQSTLNAAGGSQALSSGTFDYAIGEMTVVSTQSNGNLTVTQGLLQPEDPSLGISEELFSDQTLKLFPNPVKNNLQIQPALNMAGELSVQLFDLQGRRILEQTFQLQTGLERQELNLTPLQDATYILNVQFSHGTQSYRQTYNVIKTSQR